MFKILVLICSIAVDHSACDQSNAVDVVRSMRVTSAQQCGFFGQAVLAPTAIVPDKTQFLKVMCVRETAATAAAAR